MYPPPGINHLAVQQTPEPGCPFFIRPAAKLTGLAMCSQERFLDDVGRLELSLPEA